MTRSTRSDPSSTGATQSSRRMSIFACGTNLLSANNEGVARTVSPIDRRRTMRILRTLDQSHCAGPSALSSSTYTPGCKRPARGDDSMICRRLFILDLCFVNQHHGNVVANRLHSLARDAFQSAAVRLQLNLRMTRGTNQNFE